MTLAQAIFERLAADATLGAAVGTRIRPVQLAAGDELPFVAHARAGGSQARTVGGALLNPRSADWHFEVYAASYAQADALAEALRACLLDETWAASSDGTVSIKLVLDGDRADGQEVPVHAEELAPYRSDVDLTIHYSQA